MSLSSFSRKGKIWACSSSSLLNTYYFRKLIYWHWACTSIYLGSYYTLYYDLSAASFLRGCTDENTKESALVFRHTYQSIYFRATIVGHYSLLYVESWYRLTSIDLCDFSARLHSSSWELEPLANHHCSQAANTPNSGEDIAARNQPILRRTTEIGSHLGPRC